jgi:tetratricopeptide (TPR) repeat protein
MIRRFLMTVAAGAVTLLLGLQVISAPVLSRQHESTSARVTVNAGRENCVVELDAEPVGKTDGRGVLELKDVDPSDHYLYVHCPDEQPETAYFVSPRAGENLQIRPATADASTASPGSRIEPAELKIQLTQTVQQAVRLRYQGHLEEAVQLLRQATKMDPENSDLHRELGITFLLDKEWKRARVEMLEAIRHDPTDADAHNGLGYALEKLGEIDSALKEYRTATRLEPDNSSYRQHYLEAIGKLALKQAEKKK